MNNNYSQQVDFSNWKFTSKVSFISWYLLTSNSLHKIKRKNSEEGK